MKILGQGRLDGACFLYAIANAQRCLTGSQHVEVSKERQVRWGEMISLLNANDYLDSTIGTTKSDDNAKLQEELAYLYISTLDPESNYQVKTIHNLSDRSRFGNHVTQESVLLLPTQEHWYCLVDSQKQSAYLACSAAWQQPKGKGSEGNEERISPRLNRVYNKTMAIKDIKIFQNRAIAVSIK